MNIRVDVWRSLDMAGKHAMIRSVYQPGMSARDIAAEIGGGVTRNAIIGSYRRSKGALATECPLGVSTQEIGNMRRGRRSLPKQKPPKIFRLPYDWRAPLGSSPPQLAADPTEYDLASRQLPLVDLGRHDCKWPVNNAAPGEMHLFCGRERLTGLPYCGHHQARSHSG